MAKVELTRHLYAFFPKLEGQELQVNAATVADVVSAIEAIAPGFAFYVCDERGRLRTHVNIFIGQNRIADRTRLTDRVEPDSHVFIMQALSGGQGTPAPEREAFDV
jgi:molybdopterin synthase sulfur carrier subunit